MNNGLRLITEFTSDTPNVSIWLGYQVGARNDPPEKTGLSHYLEHMMFKGTQTFPGDSVARSYNRTGGIFNSLTSLDYTAYFATIPASELETALKLESDRMVNLLITPEDIDAERGVILQERARSAKNPEWLLSEAVLSSAYGAHPYAAPVVGRESDIRRIGQKDIEQHYLNFYRSPNATLVITGAEADGVPDLVDKYFGRIPQSPMRHECVPFVGEAASQLRVVHLYAGPSSYIHFVFRTCAGNHADVPALILLAGILGGQFPWSKTSSQRACRLHHAIVARGLANAISVQYAPTLLPGAFHVRAIIDREFDLRDTEPAIIRELEGIKSSDPPSERELACAKKRAAAALAYASDDSGMRAEVAGKTAILGWPATPDDIPGQLESVTLEDVQRVATQYLSEDRRTVGCLRAI
jgi:zinc protease